MKLHSLKLIDKLKGSYISKSFSLYTIANFIGAVTGFVAMILYTKYLQPAGYGKATMLWVFVSLIFIFVDCRLNTAFSIKFYKNSKEENTVNLYTSLLFNFFIETFYFIVFYIYPPLLYKLVGVSVSYFDMFVMYMLILFMIIGQFYTNLLMIEQKPIQFFIVKLIYSIVYIGIAIYNLLILKTGYISYLISYLIAYAVISVIGGFYFFKKYSPHKIKVISLVNLRALLKLGIPMITNGLLLMLLTWEDRYVLESYYGLVLVGIYTTGYKFAEILNNFIFTPFGQAISPMLYKECSKKIEDYKTIMSNIMNYYWIVSFGILLAYFIFLKDVFRILLGQQYSKGYDIIGIVAIGIIFLGITNIIGSTIVLKEKTGLVFMITLMSVIVNTILNFILIPRYNMFGAAYATTISYVFDFILTFIYSQKLIYIKYNYSYIFKTIVSSLILFCIELLTSKIGISFFLSFLLRVCIFIAFIFYVYNFAGLKQFIKKVALTEKVV